MSAEKTHPHGQFNTTHYYRSIIVDSSSSSSFSTLRCFPALSILFATNHESARSTPYDPDNFGPFMSVEFVLTKRLWISWLRQVHNFDVGMSRLQLGLLLWITISGYNCSFWGGLFLTMSYEVGSGEITIESWYLRFEYWWYMSANKTHPPEINTGQTHLCYTMLMLYYSLLLYLSISIVLLQHAPFRSVPDHSNWHCLGVYTPKRYRQL